MGRSSRQIVQALAMKRRGAWGEVTRLKSGGPDRDAALARGVQAELGIMAAKRRVNFVPDLEPTHHERIEAEHARSLGYVCTEGADVDVSPVDEAALLADWANLIPDQAQAEVA